MKQLQKREVEKCRHQSIYQTFCVTYVMNKIIWDSLQTCPQFYTQAMGTTVHLM